MRRRLFALAAVLALALAGCGDKGSGSGADSPLDEALGFLPEGAPFAVVIETDPDGGQWKQADKLLDKFGLLAGQAKQGALKELEESGVDYEKDLKPLLGNEAVVGSPALTDGEAEHFVAAIEAKDEGKLDAILKKQGVNEVGEKDGFKLYEDTDDGDFAARKDAVIVFADTREVLEAAVAQRGRDDRLREDDFTAALADLPEDALVRVYGDLQKLIASAPEAAPARKVPWVAALRTFGLTLSAQEDGLAIDMLAKTDSSELRPEDLPLALGEKAAPVAGDAKDFLMGLRDPSQIIEFAERTAQLVDPSGYREFELAKAQLGSKLGVDVDRDVIGQFGGNAQLAVAPDGSFAARADLAEPAAFEQTLEKTADEIPDAMPGAEGATIAKPKAGEQFYALSTADGKTVVFGVVDGRFVVSNRPERAAALASAPTRGVPGGKGALVFFADAKELAAAVAGIRGGSGAQAGVSLFAGALRDITGSVVADTGGVRLSTKIGIE